MHNQTIDELLKEQSYGSLKKSLAKDVFLAEEELLNCKLRQSLLDIRIQKIKVLLGDLKSKYRGGNQ